MSVENSEQDTFEVSSQKAFSGVGETVKGVLSAAMIVSEAITTPIVGVAPSATEALINVARPIVALAGKVSHLYLASPLDEILLAAVKADENLTMRIPLVASVKSRTSRRRTHLVDENMQDQLLNRRPKVSANRR